VTHPRSLRLAEVFFFFEYFFFAFLSVQRFVIIANEDTIETVLVGENADEMTQTEASNVLALF
jgi:hypothetical protein